MCPSMRNGVPRPYQPTCAWRRARRRRRRGSQDTPRGRDVPAAERLRTRLSQLDGQFADRWGECAKESFTVVALPPAGDGTGGAGTVAGRPVGPDHDPDTGTARTLTRMTAPAGTSLDRPTYGKR